MMTSRRSFQVWTPDDDRFPGKSGDAWDIIFFLDEKYKHKISFFSKTTLYRMEKDEERQFTQEGISVTVKCTS
jgi:hypothetical protein